MANFGIGYKGSKNRIADKIIKLFPAKNNFYDLFAGGCSITHAALESGKYTNYFCNDINPAIINLFNDAIHGKYKNESRWISREDFFNLKDKDPYIFYCWSFGNMGRTYLYAEEIEPYKKALHYAIVFNDFSLLKGLYPSANFDFMAAIKDITRRRLTLQNYFKASGVASGSPLESSADAASLLQSLTRLQSLERLESLERLNKIESLERLAFSSLSYDEIEIKPNSIIYCDIPYINTDGYNDTEFDHNAFYKWAENQKELLFISSYEMPADQFIIVAEIPHSCTLAGNGAQEIIERVFIPRHQLKLYQETRPEPLLFDDLI